MGARRARRRRPGRGLLIGAAAVVVTGTVVAVGVSRDSGPAPEPSSRPLPAGTPLAELDLSGLPIARAPFCGSLDERRVTTALGAPVAEKEQYVDGERAALTARVTDVAHEFGCSYRSADGTTARAWVFAAPVREREARTMVGSAEAGRGCVEPGAAPTFGRPGTTLVCQDRDGSTLSMRGLFGDSWLSCQLFVPVAGADAPATAQRGIRWCVHVATTLGARP
jgi:hypothetical protein